MENLTFCDSEIHSKNQKNAIVMFSGGLDSTVALWWAIDHYEKVKAFTVNYNQPHKEELRCAKSIVSLTDVEHRLITIDIPNDFWGLQNHLTRGQAGLMTAIAALDVSNEATDIVHGILRTDDVYGDCNREYLDKLAEVLGHPNDESSLGIATPLRAVKNKQEVALWGFMYGAPILYTWSCRYSSNSEPCGICPQCKERKKIEENIEESYAVNWRDICDWQMALGSPFHPIIGNYNSSLLVLSNALIDINGMKYKKPAWVYYGPDGTQRVSSIIKHIPHFSGAHINVGEMQYCVSIHGDHKNGHRWEVCFFEDGRIAATDELPPMETIQDALKARVIGGVMESC